MCVWTITTFYTQFGRRKFDRRFVLDRGKCVGEITIAKINFNMPATMETMTHRAITRRSCEVVVETFMSVYGFIGNFIL